MKKHPQHLRHDLDLDIGTIRRIFRTAGEMKKKTYREAATKALRNKSLAMIFAKPSTRTRVSFEVGMTQLGGHALYLGPTDLQLSRGETIADTARVLSRYVDGIMARVFSQDDIEALAQNAAVPVINGLSDTYHPCQALTDIYTILEKRGTLKNLTICFIGDGDNNVANSLLLLSARLGIRMIVAAPKEYTTSKQILALARNIARGTGASLRLTTDPNEAVKQADVIYTDVWVSMGKSNAEARKKAFSPYQVNGKLLARAPSHALLMHCLPAHRGEEITDEAIDGPRSIVFDQAENRLHVQKAILLELLHTH
ncbi:ornithine carbamoyltransferase [Patescibacteria group bacterium]|nr:ornithine carbamoyltransferase [Patescibacteria group bacterium]